MIIQVEPDLVFANESLRSFVIPPDPAVLGFSESIAPGTEVMGHVLSSLHPLLETFLLAWAVHGSVRFSPDDFWLVIISVFAGFVERCPTNYFPQLDSNNKIKLEALVEEVNVEQMVEGIASQIQQNLHDDAMFEVMTPTFSTSTPLDIQLMRISLMNAMKRYFSYSMGFLCGIREFEMMGTLEDWEMLRVRMWGLMNAKTTGASCSAHDAFIRYGEGVIALVAGMVENQANPAWWEKFLMYERVYSGCVSTDHMHGHVMKLFPSKDTGGLFTVPFEIEGFPGDVNGPHVLEAGFYGTTRDGNWFRVLKGWQYMRAEVPRKPWENNQNIYLPAGNRAGVSGGYGSPWVGFGDIKTECEVVGDGMTLCDEDLKRFRHEMQKEKVIADLISHVGPCPFGECIEDIVKFHENICTEDSECPAGHVCMRGLCGITTAPFKTGEVHEPFEYSLDLSERVEWKCPDRHVYRRGVCWPSVYESLKDIPMEFALEDILTLPEKVQSFPFECEERSTVCPAGYKYYKLHGCCCDQECIVLPKCHEGFAGMDCTIPARARAPCIGNFVEVDGYCF